MTDDNLKNSENFEISEKIPNILACDCGNSTISVGWVRGSELCESKTYQLDNLGNLDKLGSELSCLWEKIPEPKYIVASSVNHSALKAITAAAAKATGDKVLVVGDDLPLPIETSPELSQPKEIGTDRLCCAVAAYDQLGCACIVADFGSAATIDCVNEEGVFLGGAIMPGLNMAADALSEKTAKLPRVELAQPTSDAFGTDTTDAILHGLVVGMRGALRELIESYATKLGSWPIVILTGGDAKLICPTPGEQGLVQAIVEELCLRGIAIAYYKSLL